jgi:hypothetical protein
MDKYRIANEMTDSQLLHKTHWLSFCTVLCSLTISLVLIREYVTSLVTFIVHVSPKASRGGVIWQGNLKEEHLTE